ncbi:sucrose transport protein SUC3 isoform X3 [Malus domestica]|uniref:sucrose transport protein SUC3 isoform X3 n=1 Tax=Malus domestica TaxID=3750 RepID=UPI000498F6AC|nr:sucrose transport protein SUC3 isoform X3 [Malus domestica]XP_008389503.1 sucrose transport protein SUC3 isoform X3 [Malus domestica]XP_028947824.1 sucrose transport protein SUC3 isoform X3 [Malus domestica]XP_028947825.1 sucrose transport protein SUC3 isoform X3 [Malus domestica]
MAGRTDSESIRVPYRNLRREAEVEMMVTDEPHHRIDLNSSTSSSPRVPNGGGGGGLSPSGQPGHKHNTLLTLILSCTVAAGVQFGWALQLSLLTPYIQTLGIGHAFSSFIWLCGPITGLVVQPCVGIWSDKCSLKLGRRRPFILAGSLMISVSVVLIGFSADVGYLLGDTKEHCSTFKGTRTRAAFAFIIGFWLLDLANNTVQGPARALLADLAGPEQRNTANAVFCSWMAFGNILGFSAGASGNWHRWFPFLLSRACCEACGNLKAAFLIAVIFLTLCTLVTLYFAEEVPLTMYQQNPLSDSAPLLDDPQLNPQQSRLELSKLKRDKQVIDNANGSRTDYERDKNLKEAISKVEEDKNGDFNDGPGAVLVNLLTSLRHLPPAMHSVLIVMALTWLSWFPFFLFDTDWMGREVYHGDPNGNSAKGQAYDQGVREGAFGLLLNSVVLGISSFLIEPMCQQMGARLVWAMSNFIVFACMAGTAIISLISVGEYSKGIEHVIGGNQNIRIASLIVFALLGFPLAITYSVPFSVTAELTADAGGGQGLAIGVLNLAIVVPQVWPWRVPNSR